jgi:hypothetical protein
MLRAFADGRESSATSGLTHQKFSIPCAKFQNPKSKIQNPNKLQTPSSDAGANPRVLEFETLEFVWDLGFGFWVFQSDP